jgi:predicted transcriptional regulator
MPKTRTAKTTAERFIQVVMKHAEGTITDIATELGVTHQAVTKRLKEYRDRGVKGLPEFDARVVEVADVQALVNKYRRK